MILITEQHSQGILKLKKYLVLSLFTLINVHNFVFLKKSATGQQSLTKVQENLNVL